MRKKVGTVLEVDVLKAAKIRAVRDGRPLADLIQEALAEYLRADTSGADALRSCELFCAHGRTLPLAEVGALLQEDLLAV
jgi:hypothetical protein